MLKVTNEGLAGRAVKVAGTRVEFDAAGVAQVSAEVAEVLAQLEGYVVEAAVKTEEPLVEKKPAKKSADKKASAQDKE